MTVQELAEISLKKAVLIDFWAEWCGPCKTFGPILEKTIAKYSDQIHLEKVDVDKQQDLAAQFRVQSIPTIVLLKDGKIAGASQGALTEPQLQQWLSQKLPGLEENENQGGESELLENLPPIPSKERLEVLRSMAEQNAGDKEVLLNYCRALVFHEPQEAANLADNIQSMNGGHWLCEKINYLAQLLSEEKEGEPLSGLQKEIRDHIQSGRLEEAASAIVKNVLGAEEEDRNFLQKTGVALFSALGDDHPVNQKHRKIFNMYLS